MQVFKLTRIYTFLKLIINISAGTNCGITQVVVWVVRGSAEYSRDDHTGCFAGQPASVHGSYRAGGLHQSVLQQTSCYVPVSSVSVHSLLTDDVILSLQ